MAEDPKGSSQIVVQTELALIIALLAYSVYAWNKEE